MIAVERVSGAKGSGVNFATNTLARRLAWRTYCREIDSRPPDAVAVLSSGAGTVMGAATFSAARPALSEQAATANTKSQRLGSTTERLCFESSGEWVELTIPSSIVSEHGVEGDEQFSHTGGEDDLESFSGSFQSLGESLEDGVGSTSGEGCHVESRADGSSSAGDGACSFELAAVVVEGSQSDQSGDLLSVEASQFGEFGQEGEAGDRADAGDALKDLILRFPVVVGLDELGNFSIQFRELLVQEGQQLSDPFGRELGGSLLKTIGFGGPQGDDLTAAHDQLLQFFLCFRDVFGFPRLHALTKEGQDMGVDAIGLGELSQSTGEVTHLTRVDDGDAMSGIDQFRDEPSFVASSGFHHD